MRNIIASVNITLDGFMAGIGGSLDWHMNYWDSETCDSVCSLLNEADTILLGSNTYRAFADYWPAKKNDLAMYGEDIVLTELMNSHVKVVVSKSLTSVAWSNSFLINGDLRAVIAQLKLQPGKDIIVLGSLKLLRSLIKMNLVDRCELWLHPVIIGRGLALFKLNSLLQLTDRLVFKAGIVRLTYQKIQE